MISLPPLYAIADAAFGDPVLLARHLFDGGARLVQVRNKIAGAGELLRQFKRYSSWRPKDCQVIVNDSVDVALLGGSYWRSSRPERSARSQGSNDTSAEQHYRGFHSQHSIRRSNARLNPSTTLRQDQSFKHRRKQTLNRRSALMDFEKSVPGSRCRLSRLVELRFKMQAVCLSAASPRLR
jgi:hypothetical protein